MRHESLNFPGRMRPSVVGRVFAQRRIMKDWGHLLRLTGVFAAAVLAFLVFRPWFVPDTFGEIGHYRASAVVEARERPVRFADGQTCETCHSDVVALRTEKKSRHARIACQSCHGPLETHVVSGGWAKTRASRCRAAVYALP